MAELTMKNVEKKASTIDLRRKSRWGESIIQALLFFSGFFSIFVTIGIVYELGKEALLFFQMPDVNLLDLVTSTKWQPHTGEFRINRSGDGDPYPASHYFHDRRCLERRSALFA